jgi:hypothetical protein
LLLLSCWALVTSSALYSLNLLLMFFP